MTDVTFTPAECRALYDLIDALSGGNPENVFDWDGTDDPNDPTTAAAVKLFAAVGADVPEGLRQEKGP